MCWVDFASFTAYVPNGKNVKGGSKRKEEKETK